MKHQISIAMKCTIFAVLLFASVSLIVQCYEPKKKELSFFINDILIEKE